MTDYYTRDQLPEDAVINDYYVQQKAAHDPTAVRRDVSGITPLGLEAEFSIDGTDYKSLHGTRRGLMEKRPTGKYTLDKYSGVYQAVYDWVPILDETEFDVDRDEVHLFAYKDDPRFHDWASRRGLEVTKTAAFDYHYQLLLQEKEDKTRLKTPDTTKKGNTTMTDYYTLDRIPADAHIIDWGDHLREPAPTVAKRDISEITRDYEGYQFTIDGWLYRSMDGGAGGLLELVRTDKYERYNGTYSRVYEWKPVVDAGNFKPTRPDVCLFAYKDDPRFHSWAFDRGRKLSKTAAYDYHNSL